MPKRDVFLFIDDILESIEKIERYTKDISFEKFEKEDMIVDAVIRNFEIIGEAANKIPNDIILKYPDVEWRKMTDFRNVMIHEYFGIIVKTIWNSIKQNLPVIKNQILTIKLEVDENLKNLLNFKNNM